MESLQVYLWKETYHTLADNFNVCLNASNIGGNFAIGSFRYWEVCQYIHWKMAYLKFFLWE